MKILELFAGSRSFSNAANELGIFSTFSVDWEQFNGIDLVKDIEFLTVDEISFVPDVIWASPDCKTYSIAAISKHRNGIAPKSEYAKKCDRVNTNFINLIKQLITINPNIVFFIENPRGMFRKMPFVDGMIRHTVWYCQYGDIRAKPTDIFTNSKKWIPKKCCFNGNVNCHHEKAPRGSKTGTQGKNGSYERSIIPNLLCIEIIKSIN